MDKIVRNDIIGNLKSVEKITVLKIDCNARTMPVFFTNLQVIDL